MKHPRRQGLGWWVVIVGMTGWIGGCASEPFTRPPLPDLDHPDTARMLAVMAAETPDQFTSDDTVLIDTLFQDMTVLGCLRMDRAAKAFDLLGMNPAGIQLFMLSVKGDKTEIKSAIGPLKDRPAILLGLAEDIRRIYFDVLPGEQAKAEIGGKTVRLTDSGPGGGICYEVGDEPAVLLEKSRPGWFGPDWRVRYFNYERRDGRCFAKGIVLDNHRMHYRIVIKNRAW